MPTRTRTRIQREAVATTDGLTLTLAHFLPATEAERGVVFIPPLIGGSYLQHARTFAFITEAGYRVVSFNYRGHHRSEGRFDVRQACRDTATLAATVRRRFAGQPFFGVGTCFGSVPLFETLGGAPDLFDRLVFINAIYHLRQTSTPREAVRLYLRHEGLAWPGSLRGAVAAVLDVLFPDIDKSDRHFGILSFEAVRTGRVAWQYLFGRTPDPGRVAVPALCCYGVGDELLRLDEPARRVRYEAAFHRHFADLEILRFRADHYMQGQQEALARRVLAFFDDGAALG